MWPSPHLTALPLYSVRYRMWQVEWDSTALSVAPAESPAPVRDCTVLASPPRLPPVMLALPSLLPRTALSFIAAAVPLPEALTRLTPPETCSACCDRSGKTLVISSLRNASEQLP